MVRIDQRMPISRDRPQAAGLTEQLAMKGFESLLGLARQRRVTLKVPVLSKLADALRGRGLESLDVAWREVTACRDPIRCFKDSLIQFWRQLRIKCSPCHLYA